MTAVTIQSNEYSDDGSKPRDMLNGGHRTWFFPLVQDVVTTAGQVAVNAGSAATSASNAAAVAGSTQGTSTTSLTVGTGAKTLTTGTGKQFGVGSYVTISRTSVPTTLMHGVVTAYNSGTGSLSVTVGVAAGSGTFTDWTIGLSGPQGATGPTGNGNIPYAAKTGAYTVVAGDAAKLIDATSGTWTMAFQACATLGANWATYVRNSGTGDITLDPNASETIDGLTSYVMYPGEARLIVCDGTALRSVVLRPFVRTFASSGTFTKPPGYQMLGAQCWGGGGSGGKSSASNYAGGGGGGAAPIGLWPAAAVGATETITIGAGATGPSAANTNGAVGGTTSLGALLLAYGGGGGGQAASQAGGGGGGGAGSAGGAGGTGTGAAGVGQTGGEGGSNGQAGLYGGAAGGTSNLAAGAPNAAWCGGGGGAALANATFAGVAGGTSRFGGAGGASVQAASGGDGAAPGGGGGATQTGTKAGDGARGECRIWGVV